MNRLRLVTLLAITFFISNEAFAQWNSGWSIKQAYQIDQVKKEAPLLWCYCGIGDPMSYSTIKVTSPVNYQLIIQKEVEGIHQFGIGLIYKSVVQQNDYSFAETVVPHKPYESQKFKDTSVDFIFSYGIRPYTHKYFDVFIENQILVNAFEDGSYAHLGIAGIEIPIFKRFDIAISPFMQTNTTRRDLEGGIMPADLKPTFGGQIGLVWNL